MKKKLGIQSLAIAGAWGYIGRKFVDAGLQLGLDLSIYDPGPAPEDVPLDQLQQYTDDSFYAQSADLYHLALHPEHRASALAQLLQRAAHEPVRILNEKPMAAPERPQDCITLINSLAGTQALLLFDFPELFEPLTARIVDFLAAAKVVTIDEIVIQRSKDREDPSNPRNCKRMVHIQYQETVHCVAWLLFVLGQRAGGAEAALADGLRLSASARSYAAPNPQDYSYVVDGRVDYEIQFGATAVHGCTDFTRGAIWAKTRVVRGHADGQAFELKMDYLEGAKYLQINGVAQDIDAKGSSYEAVLQTFDHWLQTVPEETLRSSSCFPNAAFAHLTYSLSSLLWRSSHDGTPISVGDAGALLAFDARFAAAVGGFPHYTRT